MNKSDLVRHGTVHSGEAPQLNIVLIFFYVRHLFEYFSRNRLHVYLIMEYTIRYYYYVQYMTVLVLIVHIISFVFAGLKPYVCHVCGCRFSGKHRFPSQL